MCGIFGIWRACDAATATVAGLHALQHRGQEAFGLAVGDEIVIKTARKVGLVSDSLARRDFLSALPGGSAIGQVRYSTVGKKDGTDTERTRNAQPLHTTFAFGEVAIAHNGTLTNAKVLKRDLLAKGYTFESDTDTEVALKLIGFVQGEDLITRIINTLSQLEGSFAFVMLTKKKLIGMRDKFGMRPLVLGRRNEEHIFASETCALDVIGAEYIREVEPGEIVVVDNKGVTSYRFSSGVVPRPCIFEHAYFSRPDSLVYGRNATVVRTEIGRILAREHFVAADAIVPIPDSGIPQAHGFALESGIAFEPLGFIRNHYVGRTFIEPNQCNRIQKIDMKLTANRSVLKNKRVVLVDDSLVRGNTTRLLVERAKRAGAVEVHLRIAYPPWKFPCYGGIDTPTSEELLAHGCNTNECVIQKVCEETGANSVEFISPQGLYGACGGEDLTFCDACFSGNYPMKLIDRSMGL